MVTDSEQKQTSLVKVGKSSASVPGTRAQHTKKSHPRNKSYEKILNEKKKTKYDMRLMTQAERTRAIKNVLAESSRWLLHRRRNTEKIPGCRKK